MEELNIAKHLVILPLAGWGHVRPATQLGLNLLRMFPDVGVTFLPDRRGAKRTRQELSTFPDLVKSLEGRYQITELVNPSGEDISDEKRKEIFEEATSNLERCVSELYTAGGKFDRPPDVLIIDFLRGPEWVEKSRKVVAEAQVKTQIMSFSGVMTTVLQQNGNKMSTADTSLDTVTTFSDCPAMTLGQQFPHHIPGHPMFDSTKSAELWSKFGKVLFEVDGVVTCGVPEIEPNAHRSSEKKVYPVGVSVIEALGEEDIPEVMNNPRYRTDCGAVIKFLDGSMKKSGQKSVAYVSLGSVVWPKHKPEIVDWLLLSLLQCQPQISILVALASADAELSEDTRNRLEESGRAHISSWVPQRMVLAHPATSFFVSHCGWGSASEAIMAAVPIVAVPQFGDQPMVAAKLIDLGCAVQLWQFCTGLDGHKLVNGTVIQGTESAARDEMSSTWTAMTGNKGDEMRTKMGALREVFRSSVDSGGASKGLEELKNAAADKL